jgi:hypothetical protein
VESLEVAVRFEGGIGFQGGGLGSGFRWKMIEFRVEILCGLCVVSSFGTGNPDGPRSLNADNI